MPSPKPSHKRSPKKETTIELGKFYVSEKEDLGGIAVPYSSTKVYEVCGLKPGLRARVLYRDKLGDMWSSTLTSFARAVREVPEPSDWGEFKASAVSLMNDAEDLLAAREEGPTSSSAPRADQLTKGLCQASEQAVRSTRWGMVLIPHCLHTQFAACGPQP